MRDFYRAAYLRRQYEGARLKHWLFVMAAICFVGALVAACFRQWSLMGFLGIATQIGGAFGWPMFRKDRELWKERLSSEC